MEKKVLLKDIFLNENYPEIDVQILSEKKYFDREIKVGEINRPGLTLSGFYDFFASERIQLFGLGETAYLKKLPDSEKLEKYKTFFSFDVLCCVFTHGVKPDDTFLKYANEASVPVIVAEGDTTRITSQLVHVIDELFSQNLTLHATLVDVYGIGVVLMGKSGVGKSECALELVERGHRLVADDMVDFFVKDGDVLFGKGSPLLKHHMEIRGLGIINVRDIFGIRSVRNSKRIELIVLLEEWDSAKGYDRLGLDEKKYTILDIDLPYLIIPVGPGRNIPIIIETAALNYRLKKLGVNSALELDQKIQNWVSSEKNI